MYRALVENVEKVLEVRFNESKRRNEWLVQWEDFDETSNSWEPRQNLKNTIAFEEFQNSQVVNVAFVVSFFGKKKIRHHK